MVNPMKEIEITLVRSLIKRPQKQKDTVKALGLGKINSSIVHKETPQILGMIEKVKHLVKSEYKK
ncbi:MAG: 50S ribosomal protein L30 [Bacteroidetes bacterium]|jgi:large subunit ribosomal protein L30|nr:50S ribosomal protein L30 [Bacteroidota bacterium]MBT5527902.1 50S ribosomal protein L30 [Cytophagia bacterium]MBT3424919.1 50S ribosomal protein L30 [Bacteroidota bacterium]MBT3933957.1 50S ribosomal protein L30 [Bacteroidota bacterium]MBT4338240.1 50S ribosomal protein L30 [Bacteroidota bacterium]